MKTILLESIKIFKEVLKTPKIKSVKKKSMTQEVTEYDIEIESRVTSLINLLEPSIPVKGEEMDSNLLESGEYFIIDPIDGTSNFIRDIPLYGFNLAFVKDAVPVESVIYLPNRDELFYAKQGCGSYLNEDKISVANNSLSDSYGIINIDTSKYQIDKDRFDNFKLRSYGASCIDLSYLAAGRIDFAFELGSKKWDTFPGELLVKEAGGYVVDISPDKQFSAIICHSNQAEAESLIKSVSKLSTTP